MRHYCTLHLMPLLFLMISAAASQSGCSIPPKLTLSPPAPPSLTPHPTSIIPQSWVSYRDPALGVSLRYPPGWFLYPAPSAQSGHRTIISSFDLANADPDGTGQSLRNGESRIELGFHPTPYDPSGSLADWLLQQFTESPLASIHWTEANVADLPAATLAATDANGTNWSGLAVVLDESVFIVWGVPSGPEIDQILYSIRFR